MNNKNSCLLVIDVQKGFHSPYWGKRNNPQLERNIKKILLNFRLRKMNIIHIQHLSTDNHSPLFYNSSGIEFMDFSIPLKNETIITKNVNSAFIGTNLSEVLRENNIGQIYIVGLTTDHCVSTTTRMASNLGFNVTIIEDACATFEKHFKEKVINAETLHLTNLASLNNEFACITTTEKLLQHTYPVQKF